MKWLALILVVAGFSKARLPLRSSTLAARTSEHRDPATLAPAGVTDLSARPLTDSAIVLQWSEVRSSSSAIPRYAVRYGPLGSFQWATSPDLVTTGCAAPIVGANAIGGRLHACVVWNLLPNQAYQFQMVAYTGTLNSTAVFGPLSNIAEATTMERVGPILLFRPRMMLDSVPAVAQIVTPWGTWAVTVKPRYGDYLGTLQDSTGTILARGYLLLTRP